MPQIPTYTASEKAAQQNYPRDVPVEDYSGLALTGQALERGGHQVGQIAEYYKSVEEKINALKVKNNVTSVTSNYDAGVKELESGLQLNGLINSPEAALAKFREGEKKLRADSFTNAETPAAKFALDTHIKSVYPQSENNVRHIGNVKATNWNLGQLELNRDRLMGLAAQEVDPQKAREYEQQYQNLLLEAQDRSHIKPEKYASDLASFKSGVYDKRADILLNGDNGPEMFRAAVRKEVFGKLNDQGQWEGMDLTELTKKLVKATDIDQANDRRRAHAHTQEKIAVHAELEARAGSPDNPITQEEFEDMRRGKNPYVLPHEVEALEKRQTSPPDVRMDLAVHSLKQKYNSNSGVITLDRINATREEASRLGINRYNAAYTEFMGELKRDELSVRSIGIQERNKALKDTGDAIKDNLTKIPPPIGGRFIKSMIQNMNAVDREEVEKATRVEANRQGSTPDSILSVGKDKIEEIMKRRTKEAENIPIDRKNRSRIYE